MKTCAPRALKEIPGCPSRGVRITSKEVKQAIILGCQETIWLMRTAGRERASRHTF
jgi:hypothetical protein